MTTAFHPQAAMELERATAGRELATAGRELGTAGRGLATTAATTISFVEVFQVHAPFVLRVVGRMGVRDAEVEDVAQEVFVVVHRKLAQFDGRCAIQSWLFGIIYRVVRDHRRKAHVRHEVITDRPPELHTGGTETEFHHQLARLEQVLQSLDVKQRAVFVLYELEGMSMKDIADALGCPLFTAYTRLRKARRRVMNDLGADREEVSHG